MILALAGCAVPAQHESLQSAKAALVPAKPLYAGEAARLVSLDLQVAAGRELLPVLPAVPAAPAPMPNGEAALPTPHRDLPHQSSDFPVGLLPLIPLGPGGVLGGALGWAIVHALEEHDRKTRPPGPDQAWLASESARRVREVREQVAGLRGRSATSDLPTLVQADLRRELARASDASTIALRLHAPEPGTRTPADATLVVSVAHGFYKWGRPRRPGVPPLPPGLLLDIRAEVTLLDRQGKTLLRDTVIFETPHSRDPEDEARLSWWLEGDRYRQLLQLAGRAFAEVLTAQVLSSARYANDADYAAQVQADNDVPAIERENRLHAVLQRFRRCDDFVGIPLDQVKFDIYRGQADGDVYVGLKCGSAGLSPASGSQ